MRRTIPAMIVTLLILGATPVAAMGAEPSPSAAPATSPDADPSGSAEPEVETGVDPAELVRAEVPTSGLAMGFPADWRVSMPEGERLSALTTADGDPVMETTALSASGPDAWCNVDVYLAIDVPLIPHAVAYSEFLAQSAGAESMMNVVETELPVGPAVRMEIFDPERGRLRSFILFDGPTAEDGTVDRFLFSCAAPGESLPFWRTIAESAEVFEKVAPDPSAAAGSPAAAESPAS